MANDNSTLKSHRGSAPLQILEGLCEFFNKLRNKGYTEFNFDKSIVRRDIGDGGLGLGEWGQDFVNIQLKKLVQMGKLELVNLDTYRLTDDGKKACEKTS
ncbi:MAG TPA: hypothetical protein VF884_05430 [Nitrososphaeraceae archaeon]